MFLWIGSDDLFCFCVFELLIELGAENIEWVTSDGDDGFFTVFRKTRMAFAATNTTADSERVDIEYFGLVFGIHVFDQLLDSLSDFNFVGIFQNFKRVFAKLGKRGRLLIDERAKNNL